MSPVRPHSSPRPLRARQLAASARACVVGHVGAPGDCERLAAMVDSKTGTPIQLASSFSRWGHTRQAFEQWALALKSALQTNPDGTAGIDRQPFNNRESNK